MVEPRAQVLREFGQKLGISDTETPTYSEITQAISEVHEGSWGFTQDGLRVELTIRLDGARPFP